MILVVNLNASVDKKYEIGDISKGKIMRARAVQNTPGGKGIHVANVATILGEPCVATGFLGGKSGEFIEEKLVDYGIKGDFTKIKGETRECLAFITDDLVQTEILEPGPNVSDMEMDEFFEKYTNLCNEADIIVASGSAPKNAAKDVYGRLIKVANEKNKKFLLDTSGELLKQGINARPFFIKPNKDEIEDLTGNRIETEEDAIREIKNFQSEGIKFVVVSLGEKGSIAGYKNKFYKVSFERVNAVNPVGSGDSFVAGVAVALSRNYSIEDTLRLASACGTANALEEETGFVRAEVVSELFDKVKVEEI